jgi:hypothetical protein
MKRRPEFRQINTLKHWNDAHIKAGYPYPGLDTYFTLSLYYREFLISKGCPDIFGFGPVWLDFGCGNAAQRFEVFAAPANVTYIGCDFSDSVLEKNKKLRPDIQWLKKLEPGKQYNFISSLHTFEHLDNPQKTWEELWPFVKDVLVIQVPYQKSFYMEEHPWEFDENSFQTPVPPIVIIGPKMNLVGDREICYVWYKNNPPGGRQIHQPYTEQYSPQGWFLWHLRLGLARYYWPTMFSKQFGFLKKNRLFNFLKKYV